MEMSPEELAVMAQVSHFFKALVLGNASVWSRHVKRVLYWCPLLETLFALEKQCPFAVFTKYLFPYYADTLKKYRDNKLIIRALVESVYRLNVPRNLIEGIVVDVREKDLIFTCNLFARGASAPLTIFMGTYARNPTMNFNVVNLHPGYYQCCDEAFNAVVWDGDASKYESPRVYYFPKGLEENE